MNKNYLNEEICRACGGKCCKVFPGCYFPEDFGKPLKAELKSAIISGNIAIDWWEGDVADNDERSRSYFFRPKIKGVDEVLHASWGGECVFLTSSGCKIKPNERPKSCRLLEPASDDECKIHKNSGKKGSCVAWLKHEKIINEIVNELTEERP